jgi:organic hydroperoxide reductase OsmC/OhrA
MDAEGDMERVDGETRFVSCVLRPHITVASSEDTRKIEKAIQLSEKGCFIGNSVNFDTTMEPQISIRQ